MYRNRIVECSPLHMKWGDEKNISRPDIHTFDLLIANSMTSLDVLCLFVRRGRNARASRDAIRHLVRPSLRTGEGEGGVQDVYLPVISHTRQSIWHNPRYVRQIEYSGCFAKCNFVDTNSWRQTYKRRKTRFLYLKPSALMLRQSMKHSRYRCGWEDILKSKKVQRSACPARCWRRLRWVEANCQHRRTPVWMSVESRQH